MLLLTAIICGATLLICGIQLKKNNEPIYSNGIVEVYKTTLNNDIIQVKNNGRGSVDITVGENKYTVASTSGKKVDLAINSDYGIVPITIGKDTITINYSEPVDTSNDIIITPVIY